MAAEPDGDPSTPTLPPKVSTYEVVAGETLLGIARNFGITPETILWANGMASGDLIGIGQKLTILPVSGVLHEVKPEESVLSIAESYHADPAEIVEANQITDPSLVREGDLLLVPGGVMKPGGSEAPAADPAPTAAPAATPAPEPVADSNQDRESSSRGGPRDGKSFVATMTAYAIQGRTATGTHTSWGVIAVDTATIPLGSNVRIDGFEELFVAEDTGGGIRGNWVDLWFPNYADAMRFCIQARRVTIVEQ